MFTVAYTVLLMIFNNGFEGNLKDLKSDPVNLMKRLGARIKHNTLFLGKQTWFWMTIKALALFIGSLYILKDQSNPAFLIVGIYAFLYMLILKYFIDTFTDTFNNKKIVSLAGRIEILTYFALITALTNTIGTVAAAILIIYPISWFIIFNRLSWGTWLWAKV